MGCLSKGWALVLILTIAFSSLTLLMVKPANAQTTPMASVPQFTLKYVDNSYNVPPVTTSTTDPYTGKTTTLTTSGYHVENKSIEIIITNQPFTPYKDENGNNIQLYFNINSKPHSEDNWYNGNPSIMTNWLYDSSSPTTIISYFISNISEGNQIDYKIQAQIGYYTTIRGALDGLYHEPTHQASFTAVATSDWSPTQTVMIGQTSSPTASSTIQSPTPASSSVPEFSWLVVVVFLARCLVPKMVKNGYKSGFAY